MRISSSLLSLAPLFVSTGTADAADLFVTPSGGPGTYASIGAAVEAAAPGDIIFVAPGDYVEGFTISKSLTILAEPGAVLHHPTGEQPDPVLIWKLRASDRVVISGLAFRAPAGTVPAGAEFLSIRALGNEGSIVLHDLDVQPGHYNGLLLQNSQQVLLLESNLTGSLDGTACALPVRPLVQLTQSTLYVDDSELRAASASPDGSPCPFASGGVALFANHSDVVLSGSLARGGEGTQVAGVVLAPGAALSVSNSQVELRASVASGGNGAAGTSAAGAIGAGVSFNSLLQFSLGGSITGGVAGDGSTTAPNFVLLSGSIADATDLLFPRLELLQPTAPAGSVGQPFALGLAGHPDDVHLLFFASGVAAGTALPGVAGESLLSPSGMQFQGRVALDGTGAGQWSGVIPDQPSLVGLTAYFQNLAPAGPTPAFGNVVLLPIAP
jgi:hypothetical protein